MLLEKEKHEAGAPGTEHPGVTQRRWICSREHNRISQRNKRESAVSIAR
jgi:hypothetical protein